MIASIVTVVILAVIVFGPVAWSLVRERRAKRALALQAEIQYAVDRRLGGTSYLMVHVEPPTLWHAGRVVLAAPRVAESLVDTAAPTALALTPSGYELVIALGSGSHGASANGMSLPRAA